MAKQAKRPETRASARNENPGNVIFAGVICLAVGLAVGYYFGKQSAVSTGAATPPVQAAPISNPTSFTQDEAALKAVPRSNPKDLRTLIQLGDLYYDNGRFREAVDWYGRALEIDSKNPNVHTDRGTSYWNLGEADPAIAEFRKSLEIDPAHAQTLYNLGVVYLHGKNNPEEARKAWERLLSTNPNYPDREKVREQLAALSRTGSPPAGQSNDNMQDLLHKLKSRPPQN